MSNLDAYDAKIYRGRQTIHCHVHYEHADGHKLRALITSDSYDFQSSARMEIWSEKNKCWNEIATIPPLGMKTPSKLCYLPNEGWNDIAHFEPDLETLENIAECVLV